MSLPFFLGSQDKKPSDWVDDSMMDDPEDKKPEGWVEEKRIVDANAPLLKGSEVEWMMRMWHLFVTLQWNVGTWGVR